MPSWSASLHFPCSIPNPIVMEYCNEPSEISRALVRDPIRIEDSYATVPEQPGLGVEPDPGMPGKYLVRE